MWINVKGVRIESIRHTYKLLSNANVSNSDYTLFDVDREKNILPNIVRIELDQRKSKSQCDLQFRIKDNPFWKDATKITGIRIHDTYIYKNQSVKIGYGDHQTANGKKSFIVFRIVGKWLVIDYFRGFYPNTPTHRTNLLNAIKFQ